MYAIRSYYGAAETLLENSGLGYVIVRTAKLTDGP